MTKAKRMCIKCHSEYSVLALATRTGSICRWCKAGGGQAMTNDKIEEIRARHEEGIRAGADDDRAALLAEVERLRGALAMAAGYVRYCHDAWHETRDLAEAWRDLTKIREVLNDERAGELEAKS